MGDANRRAVVGVDPAAHAHGLLLKSERVDTRLLEQGEKLGRDAGGEVGTIVRAEIQIHITADAGGFEHASLDDLEGVQLTQQRPVGSADGVERVRPDAAPGVAGFPFEGEHVGRQRPVVVERIDPRHAGPQHLTLHPQAVIAIEMGEETAMAVDAPPGGAKLDPPAGHERVEGVACGTGERPRLESRPPEGELRRLRAHQPHLAHAVDVVVQHHRVAVDDFGDLCRAQLGRGGGSCAGGGERGDDQRQRQAQGAAFKPQGSDPSSTCGVAASERFRRKGFETQRRLSHESHIFYVIPEAERTGGMDARYHRNDLFPDIEPYATGMLQLDHRHVMYWEQSGNPKGLPVVFLHGGPGAGAAAAHRRFFDPRTYRIIVFDQRGCGRSIPHADLADNTTQHIVDDMEALRRHLGIRRWLLFGGSWGSTLALAYGIRWPERCSGFILRGVFLGTRREVDWFLYGMGTIFPEAWRAFSGALPAGERHDLLHAYYRRLVDADPTVHHPAAAAWSRYETVCSNLMPRTDEQIGGSDAASLALARIEAHYFVNDVYLRDGPLLDAVHTLHAIPASIVQGRYDMVCPIVTADALARAWPQASYTVVPDAGHSAMEPGIRSALVRATEAMKGRFGAL